MSFVKFMCHGNVSTYTHKLYPLKYNIKFKELVKFDRLIDYEEHIDVNITTTH